ncbi:MAG: histidine kinase N-terminal domain-containing protein [Arcanobacterium sp.]|nr:histidine kinase N-terminal domain-containing protein [Arcanobacterium sp.]
MPILTKVFEKSGEFSSAQQEWLHQLVGDWQAVSDLAFSDLVLYLPVDSSFLVGAHARPATAATMVEADIVGTYAGEDIVDGLSKAHISGRIVRYLGLNCLHTFVPVKHSGRTIAVVHVLTAQYPDRTPNQRHLNYGDIAQTLLEMIASGDFPLEGTPTGFRHGTPRVSDGLVHLDEDGTVLYASPNSVSHFRRLGIKKPLTGLVLLEEVTGLIEDYAVPEETLPVVLMGRAAWMTEFDSRGVIISMRALPLIRHGERVGAVLFTRDISELRRQERQLLSKDATIREINHRVKNNLQTVSALLRLQARRADNEGTRSALEQAMRRVEMIAIVHEGLSQNIDEVVEFDEVFGSLLRIVRDIAVTDSAVDIEFSGSFGRVRAEQATALAVVLNEVISNAIEHGLTDGGLVQVDARRNNERLAVIVRDNGKGISDLEPGSGLGTKIVKTLVKTELQGSIAWRAREDGGTEVLAQLRLR